MKQFWNQAWKLIKETAEKFKEDDPVIYGAGIAFFMIFSMPPILIIIISVAGVFFGEQAVEGELSQQISKLVGSSSAEAIEGIVKNARMSGTSTMATIIGVATLIFSATVVFNFIQKSLNKIWQVKPKPERSFVKFLTDRLISFSMIIVFGFLMLVTLMVDTILAILRNYLKESFAGMTTMILEGANFIISFTIVSFIFALIFKFLPDAKIRWKDVGIGAIVTAFLYTVGKYLIGYILGKTSIASTYGAAGSLAAILLWVFYSTLIMLIGAEFTQVYSKDIGKKIRPKKHAVRIESHEIEVEEDKKTTKR